MIVAFVNLLNLTWAVASSPITRGAFKMLWPWLKMLTPEEQVAFLKAEEIEPGKFGCDGTVCPDCPAELQEAKQLVLSMATGDLPPTVEADK